MIGLLPTTLDHPQKLQLCQCPRKQSSNNGIPRISFGRILNEMNCSALVGTLNEEKANKREKKRGNSQNLLLLLFFVLLILID